VVSAAARSAPALRPAAIAFGLAGAPFAWIGHELLTYALAAYPCFPNDTALTRPLAGWDADRLALIGIDLIAALVAAAATYVAWSGFLAVRASAHESGLQPARGPRRFLAVCGLLAGAGFLAAILFDTLAAVMAPLCAA
jgi:hypothetical protein